MSMEFGYKRPFGGGTCDNGLFFGVEMILGACFGIGACFGGIGRVGGNVGGRFRHGCRNKKTPESRE